MNGRPADFLLGVIEGFYGPPWGRGERTQLFGRMAQWKLNAYLYAPKDDLKHRALWRESYSPDEIASLRSLIQQTSDQGIQFRYGLAPGLDARYSDESDFNRLLSRLDQMLDAGCRHFALLFDDIPDRMRPEDRAKWPSFAEAHCDWANRSLIHLTARSAESSLAFCPTPYCGRMAAAGLGGGDYLDVIGSRLNEEIRIFWTGPEIVSETIPISHLREVAARFRRKPLLWDNLHANDYDGRRFFCGPYAGREPGIVAEVSGILLNPNTEFPLNFVPIRSLGEFCDCRGTWDPRESYLRGMREWSGGLRTSSGGFSLEDWIAVGDCFYLPYEDGREALRLWDSIASLLAEDSARWQPERVKVVCDRAQRLKDTCARLAELNDRDLFHAMHRRIWELREELDLILAFIRWKSDPDRAGARPRSDFHLPKTYRGGLVARLQGLLEPHPDGGFVAVGNRNQRGVE